MPQLPAMGYLDRFVETVQKFQSVLRDSGHHHSPIRGLPPTRDQTTLLQAVEQSRNIWIPCNHAVSDLAARKPFRRPAQYAEHVVLRGGEVLGLEHLGGAARQQIARTHQVQKSSLLGTSRPPFSTLRLDPLLHTTSILLVITTIVKTHLSGTKSRLGTTVHGMNCGAEPPRRANLKGFLPVSPLERSRW